MKRRIAGVVVVYNTVKLHWEWPGGSAPTLNQAKEAIRVSQRTRQ